jgi:hypothetical protein
MQSVIFYEQSQGVKTASPGIMYEVKRAGRQFREIWCTLGWVDIGTRARVLFRFVVYLKKSRGNDKKLVFSSNHFSVGTGHTVQYTT